MKTTANKCLRYYRWGNILQVLSLALILFTPATAWATELRLPEVQGKAGQEIQIPLVISQTGNLAGVKIVINYNQELLSFREGVKTPATQSLMHIINDKNPGRLIIVMAGARGIQGRDLTLMNLTFVIKRGLTENHRTVIEVTEIQLMSDDLREIPAKVKNGLVVILP